ncbi:uncharacterized protein C8R40DRAFT_1146570 [Lentinula edodes]|uniref:uncharacterized protein n=1 Tax=Lentinula edodes TaxID=5353 RepID=UPI001E8D9890|nr:uncharacterized protein C8R40DRAFT_1146570 [Lentinula edodes]KAH7875633.1 hypothetical protein C8R40DRAFT_1146570 [Lentinula edodes]
MFNAEESYLFLQGSIMDAVRISDNKPVMLKAVSRIIHPQEVKIGMYFSDKSIASDPRNHCIPIYDVFPVADSEMDLIVMPVLRPFENPQFDTVGEVIAFIQQLLEGIQFMHEHLVAHGDCTEMNIMMDGSRMYPKGWNTLDPWQARDDPFRAAKRAGFRMQFWPKYYLIDFGLSHMYTSKSTVSPLERILRGGDKSAPEHAPEYKRANPFSTDIYYIGNLIRENFTERRNSSLCKRFCFLKPLVDSMVQDDPVKRPTIDDVVMKFDAVVRKNRRNLKFRAAACDLQHFQFTDQIPALFRRFTKYFVMTRSLPVLPHPERHLSSELCWMYSGSPTKYPEVALYSHFCLSCRDLCVRHIMIPKSMSTRNLQFPL